MFVLLLMGTSAIGSMCFSTHMVDIIHPSYSPRKLTFSIHNFLCVWIGAIINFLSAFYRIINIYTIWRDDKIKYIEREFSTHSAWCAIANCNYIIETWYVFAFWLFFFKLGIGSRKFYILWISNYLESMHANCIWCYFLIEQ